MLQHPPVKVHTEISLNYLVLTVKTLQMYEK